MIAAATIAVAVIAAGIAWSAGGSPAPRPSPTNAGNQNAALDDLPPGVVTVTGKRTGGDVRFTWIYDGAEAADTFLWRFAGSDTTNVIRRPRVEVKDEPGTQLCIQVKVIRADGNGSADWSPEGCGS